MSSSDGGGGERMLWRDVRPGDTFRIIGGEEGTKYAGAVYTVVSVRPERGALFVGVLLPGAELEEWSGEAGEQYYGDELLAAGRGRE